MIISASRRTDIPACHSDWFLERIRQKALYIRNPYNTDRISGIDLSPEVVDCIVFWTKDPLPLLPRLDELKDYSYYFQFTITPYGSETEPGLRSINSRIETFIELSRRTGRDSVIWRWDPILISNKYSEEFHLDAFRKTAERISGCTDTCVFSFMDDYIHIRKRIEKIGLVPTDAGIRFRMAERMAVIAGKYGINLKTCCETDDFSEYGIKPSSCIDGERIQKLTGRSLRILKNRNQRPLCGCTESIDIGAYDTCRNGCLYCYASRGNKKNRRSTPSSPLLCDELKPGEEVEMKKCEPLKSSQLEMGF